MKIEIYTTRICWYCDRAKNLLKMKNIKFIEIDVSDDQELRKQMVEKTNGLMTVPQIFLNGEYLSDSDGLYELDRSGKLDSLISQTNEN
jgi:glutaredoxin 3